MRKHIPWRPNPPRPNCSLSASGPTRSLRQPCTERRRNTNAGGRTEHFAALRAFITAEGDGQRYDETASRLGLAVSLLKVGVMRLRREFREQLRHEMAGNVSDPMQSDDEIRHLRSLLFSDG